MADNVVVTYTPSNMLSWDTAEEQWNSPSASKEWDNFGDHGILDITITEELGINSSYATRLKFILEETMFINDFNFDDANVVMNDIDIQEVPMDMDDFINRKNNLSPLGYQALRPLYPGEYTYDKAIVGIQMRANLSENRLGFYGAKLSIDVEDVVERGRTEILEVDKETPIKIEFKKRFYKAPEEIMTNVISADEPAWVDITETTSDYFVAILRSMSSSQPVAGVFSWLAYGY